MSTDVVNSATVVAACVLVVSSVDTVLTTAEVPSDVVEAIVVASPDV